MLILFHSLHVLCCLLCLIYPVTQDARAAPLQFSGCLLVPGFVLLIESLLLTYRFLTWTVAHSWICWFPLCLAKGFQRKKQLSTHCCQRLRPRIPLLLLGTRSWALGISSRDRAALLGLLAISFLEFWGFPHWRLGFRAAFPYGGLRAWGPPCYCPTAPGWPCSFPRAEPSEAFFQETAATEKGHCCSGGRWLERV